MLVSLDGFPGLGQIARGQFARSFFEGFIEDLFLLFIRSAVPRERSFKSFFFILGGLTKSRGTFRASIEPSRSTRPAPSKPLLNTLN